MKKAMFLLIALPLFLIGCSKGKSAKQIAEEVCECSKNANALPASDPNRSKAQDDCATKQRTAWNKVKDDMERADEFNKVIGVCAEEQIKKSFGQ